MYTLSCSKITNNKAKKLIDQNPESAEKVRETASIEKISYLIFNDEIDERLYINLSISLTLGDELRLPISKTMADILFFALCTNADSRVSFTIRNLTQAKTLFDLYENNYRGIELEDVKENRFVRFTELKANHSAFYPGYSIIWKIPVSFFSSKTEDGQKKSNTTLSGLTYAIAIINDEEHKIPRKIYTKFFKTAIRARKGRLVCSSTDELKELFDLNDIEAIKEVLSYLGFSSKPELRGIQIPNGVIIIEDNKLISHCFGGLEKDKRSWENPESAIYWKKIAQAKYILLPRYNYVPIKHDSNNLQFVTLLT